MGRKDLRTVFVPLFAIVFLRLQNRDSESNLYLSSDFLHESCSWLPGSLIRSGWSTYSSAHPPSLLSVLLTFKYNIQESSRCGYLPQGQLLTRQETVTIIWCKNRDHFLNMVFATMGHAPCIQPLYHYYVYLQCYYLGSKYVSASFWRLRLTQYVKRSCMSSEVWSKERGR